MKLKLYLVTRKDDWGYDDYDQAVVCAGTPEYAIQLLKDEHGAGGEWGSWGEYDVVVTEIPLVAGIVLESFNAG